MAPLTPPSIRTALLGSMPSVASLEAGEYYAHPRNAFWDLVADVFGFAKGLSYEQRCAALMGKGAGVWDVLAECVRPGSMDSAIDPATARANDLGGWLDGHPLAVIGLNGSTAARMFRKFRPDSLHERIVAERIRLVELPSSSPANARMAYAAKLRAWRGLT